MQPNGDHTPRPAFYAAILQVLIQMHGKGRSHEVLDRVQQTMRKTITLGDCEPRSRT